MGLVNETDVEWTEYEAGESRFRRKELATAAGGEALGCSLYELPPGARSWPYHHHAANEEALYVLDGTGTLRLDGEEHALRAGDYVPFPADESGAHQVLNDGEEPLRYLATSTMNEPDVIMYPDTGKLGVFVGSPPGGRGERSFHGYYRVDDEVDYWE